MLKGNRVERPQNFAPTFSDVNSNASSPGSTWRITLAILTSRIPESDLDKLHVEKQPHTIKQNKLENERRNKMTSKDELNREKTR